MKLLLLAVTASALFATSLAANRLIQFRNVDFTTRVVELHNFDDVAQDLGGWRFCSHDENQERRYSSSAGLNGITLPAGESLFIHFLNDAPADDSSAINISQLGNFATPLDQGAYAIQLYNGGSFGNGANILDHLQWSIDGISDASADRRNSIAQSGGTWTNQNAWISTTAESESITLTNFLGVEANGPADYTIAELLAFPEALEVTAIEANSAGEVTLSWEDLSSFGAVNYTVEMTTDLADEESWVALFRLSIARHHHHHHRSPSRPSILSRRSRPCILRTID